MSVITQIFEHKRPISLNGLGTMIGDLETSLLDRVTLSSWATIASSSAEIGEASISNINIVEMEVHIDNRIFIIPVFEWTSLTSQTAGSGLSDGNNTALRAYEEDGDAGIYILVGKSDSNIPLIQTGAGISPSGSVVIELHISEASGGLIDRLIYGTGQRQLIAMQCDQDARPNPPPHGTDLRHNGRQPTAATLSTGEVWWPSGQRTRSLTTKTWFAFGEAVYDNQLGVWKVIAAWYVVDQSDHTNVQFGRNWDSTWGNDDYIVGLHRYARIRRDDGSYTIRYIGVDGAGHDKRWIPLTEQFIDGSSLPYEPYPVRTNFEFYPSEWRTLSFEWEWGATSDSVGGVTYYRKASTMIRASDIVGNTEQNRSATIRTPGHTATSWFLLVNSEDGMHAIRQAGFAGGLTGVAISLQFESSDSSDNSPITHIRLLERSSSQLSVTGWLRTYVI